MTLNSVAMESVTSIRSTSDSYSFFVEGTKRWWWHMYSSRFIQALGKFAFYDNRFTSKRHTHPLSACPKLEMIWLGLSCGPIGIGDPIGKENTELIRRVVKEDGEIIKPDMPAVPLDKCYLYNPHVLQSERGVTVYSYSKIGENEKNTYAVRYLLTFNVHPLERKVCMDFQLKEAGAEENQMYALYDYFSEEMRVVSALDVNSFIIRRRKFYYHIAAPIQGGIAFLGNTAKHVTCSRQLVKKVVFQDCGVSVQVYSEKIDSRKWQAEFSPVWTFYCRKKPGLVTFDGKSAEVCWKDGVLKVRGEVAGSNDAKEFKEIKIEV
jgi:hypothetical protein